METMPKVQTPRNSDEGLALIAKLLLPYLRDKFAITPADGSDPDDWVDVAAEHPTLKRLLFGACRDGRLRGRKVGRRWLARRKHLDAFIEADAPKKTASQVPRTIAPPTNVSSLDSMRERLGLERKDQITRSDLIAVRPGASR
jgi:hypothetical protein